MKKRMLLVGLLLLIATTIAIAVPAWALPGTETAQDDALIQQSGREYGFWRSVAGRAAAEAWKLMGEKPGDMLVLSNAGYTVVGDYTTEACLDGLSEANGCSAGQKNLLDVHSAWDNDLFI